MREIAIGRDFYMRPATAVARELLGKILVSELSGRASGRISEVEAYMGNEDAAAHSYKQTKPTPGHRTEIMFAPGGHAYIYLSYGIHSCFNIVANCEGVPEGVLIRGISPLDGVELMIARRGVADLRRLADGPGKVTQALGITRAQYGLDLTVGRGIYLLDAERLADSDIMITPRIGVDYAGSAALYPYRFIIKADTVKTRRG